VGRDIKGKTVGLVGMGDIGKAVYKHLLMWGCTMMAYDPYVLETDRFRLGLTFVDQLEELLTLADVVSLHVPLCAETYHLLDREKLTYLKQQAIVLNTARGAVVDEMAMLGMMPAKKGMYVADVFETEPTVRRELLEAPFVIATPHIAAMTEEANLSMTTTAIENFIQDRPINLKGDSIYRDRNEGGMHETAFPSL
jgi:phosphoglycerate dehydrogenase-like enzyme